jgi:hypothetical protein
VKQAKQQPRPAPVRVMVGDQLAAVITSVAGQIDIRPEPGWHVTEARITVDMRRDRQPRQEPA